MFFPCLVFAQTRFQVSFPKTETKLDGRLLLLISNNNSSEPRMQISDGHDTQMVFGLDLENHSATQIKEINATNSFGYPIQNLSKIPAGEYYVQVLVHKYETFKRKDGHTVKLPMDRGEGQQWNLAPGNIYSTPIKLKINPKKTSEEIW